MIEYHVYDLPSGDGFMKRWVKLRDLVDSLGPDSPIRLVWTVDALDQEHLDELYAEWVEMGYEGQMVRLDGTKYENKRAKQLLKRKEFLDEEYTILDIVEGIGNRTGMAGYAVMKLTETTTFKSNIKGDREFLRQVLKRREELIGKEATVTYFNLTPAGVPRFGRIKAIHETARW